MATGEVAIFNVERTILFNVFRNALNDLGISPVGELKSVRQSREQLLGWLAGKKETELDPLLDATADRVYERLLPWAKPVLDAQAKAGRAICLLSVSVPDIIMEAISNGLQAALPEADFEFTFGKPLITERGRFTGRVGDREKTKAVEGLIEKGYQVNFLVDSFTSGLPAVKYAKHPFMAGVSRSINPADRNFGLIDWNRQDPNQVSVRPADERAWYNFDMAIAQHREAFVESLQLDD